ncbi:MAG: HNH endonuclease [Sulfurimonadaceae bacterium]
MTFEKHFKDELTNTETQYFILDATSGGKHGDVDFAKYTWSRSQYNLVKEGDVVLFRRPGKASQTSKFYFFGAAKIGSITGKDTVTAQLIKTYPFQEYLHQKDLDNFKWSWKGRGKTWEHFFNQYGMNKIPKDDFIKLIQLSEGSEEDDNYDAIAATKATQDIQNENYSVDDRDGKVKIRAKHQAFANDVKANYKNKCAICLLASRAFLIGSHIVPWSVSKEIRIDPSNGICLCSIHDKAFDEGFITIDDKYKVIVSKNIAHDPVLKDLLEIYDDKKLKLPKKSPPNKQFLKYHREEIFERFITNKRTCDLKRFIL